MHDVLVRRPPSSVQRIHFSRAKPQPRRAFAQELLRWGLTTIALAGFASLAVAWVANLLE